MSATVHFLIKNVHRIIFKTDFCGFWGLDEVHFCLINFKKERAKDRLNASKLHGMRELQGIPSQKNNT